MRNNWLQSGKLPFYNVFFLFLCVFSGSLMQQVISPPLQRVSFGREGLGYN